MGNYKLVLDSRGYVALELEGIPTEAEKKSIDELIAPDGFIVTQTFKKLKTLGEYVSDVVRPAPTQTASQAPSPAPAPKTQYDKCPTCGRNTVSEHTVTKVGKNTGRKFKSCFNKKDKAGNELPLVARGSLWQQGMACNYFEWTT